MFMTQVGTAPVLSTTKSSSAPHPTEASPVKQAPAGPSRLSRAASWLAASASSVGSAVSGAMSRAVTWVKAQAARADTASRAAVTSPPSNAARALVDTRKDDLVVPESAAALLSNKQMAKELFLFAKKEYSTENVKFMLSSKYLLQAIRQHKGTDAVSGQLTTNFLAYYGKYVRDRGAEVGDDPNALPNVNLSSQVRNPLDQIARKLGRNETVTCDKLEAAVVSAQDAVFYMLQHDTMGRMRNEMAKP